MRMKLMAAWALALAAGGCATAPQGPPAPVPPPVPQIAPGPKGLSAVMGKRADQVTSLLGAPALSRAEAGAELRQYRAASCILDVYFYRDRPNDAATARYAEARTPAGARQDAAACIDAQLAVRKPG